MENFAYTVWRIAGWIVPVLWLGAAWLSWLNSLKSVAALFFCTFLLSIIWNFLFLPNGALPGQPLTTSPVAIFYDDAPLGFLLSCYLPVLANISLVSAVALLIIRKSN